MYTMSHYIEISDKIGNFIPAPLIYDIIIERSIKNLADTAIISCGIFHMNNLITYKESFESKEEPTNLVYKLYKRGQKIRIFLGYDGNLKTEFVGYIREVKTIDSTMTIECEDELFIFRGKNIPNKEFNEISLKKIARYVCDQINPKIKVVCDYDMGYEKFTIYKATGLDVLKQIQEDTGADIYFKSSLSDEIGKNNSEFNIIIERQKDQFEKKPEPENLELHIRMPYLKKENLNDKIDFSFQHNIESSSLEYVDTTDKKVKVKITTSNRNGTTQEVEFGNTGGEEFEYKVNRISNAEMKKRAKLEFNRLMSPGYTGSFTSWLIPFVEPNNSIGIYDNDFPEKHGIYNIESIKTEFSEQGGRRTISPGIKLSKNETKTNILADSVKKKPLNK